MRLAPRDRAQSKRIRGAASACSRLGEGYYLIGFDWEPHPAHAFTHANAKSYAVRHDDRCYRALVKVTRRGSYFAATVMQIGGEPTPYSVHVRLYGDNASTEWHPPHPLDVLELEAIQREVK